MLSRDELLTLIHDDPALMRLLRLVKGRLDDDPGHDLAHCLRVALWTIALSEPGVDRREAIAAALLHDIINVPKNHPDRAIASVRCADFARDILPEYGFDADAILRITDAIRDHSFSRGAIPEGPLGRALQDADRLEALGVIGLFRCISTGVRMGARYFHDEDPFAQDRPLDDRAYSIDHFTTKLLKLPDTMLTPRGREEAHHRAAYLRQTLSALAHELGERDPTT